MRSGCVCVYATNRTHMNWQHAPCSNISCRRGTHIARTTLRMIDLLSCWQSNFRLSFSPDSCALIFGIWYTIHGNRHVAFGVGIWSVHDVLWPSKCDNNNYIYHVLWAANKGQKYTGHHNCFPIIVLLFLYLSLMCLLCHSLSCFSRIGPMAMHSGYGPVSLLSDGPCENFAFAIRASKRLNRYWIGLLAFSGPTICTCICIIQLTRRVWPSVSFSCSGIAKWSARRTSLFFVHFPNIVSGARTSYPINL